MKRKMGLSGCIIFLISLLFTHICVITVKAEEEVKAEVHFIDSGQSDCILIKAADGNYLIDTGAPETEDSISKYLADQNINKLNGIILTHYHDDHTGGIKTIIRNIQVDTIFFPNHENSEKYKLCNILANKEINIQFINKGWEFHRGCVNFKAVLPAKGNSELENNNSIVVLATIDDVRYLFMGDAEKKEEMDLLKNSDVRNCHILKVGHHALDTGTSEKFLKYIRPSAAIVTCNGGESPSPKVISRMKELAIPVFRTDINGSIIVKKNRILNDGEDIEIMISSEKS